MSEPIIACLSLIIVVMMTACSDIGDSRVQSGSPVSPSPAVSQEIKKEPPKPVSVATESVPKPAPATVRSGEITGVDMGRVFTMTQAGQALLVDCRPPLFYSMGHIDGAINLPLKGYAKVLGERRKQLDAAQESDKVIVLYCQNVDCPDAYAVAKKLTPLGYSVSIYKGGWEEWKQAGF